MKIILKKRKSFKKTIENKMIHIHNTTRYTMNVMFKTLKHFVTILNIRCIFKPNNAIASSNKINHDSMKRSFTNHDLHDVKVVNYNEDDFKNTYNGKWPLNWVPPKDLRMDKWSYND